MKTSTFKVNDPVRYFEPNDESGKKYDIYNMVVADVHGQKFDGKTFYFYDLKWKADDIGPVLVGVPEFRVFPK